ncbi:MAG: hypothetical protein ACLGIB_02400 [Actinomycetota bacterium]
MDAAAIDPAGLYLTHDSDGTPTGVIPGEWLEPVSDQELQQMRDAESELGRARWMEQQRRQFFASPDRSHLSAFGEWLELSVGLDPWQVRGHVRAILRVEKFCESQAETLDAAGWRRYLTEGPHVERTKRHTLKAGQDLHRWAITQGFDWADPGVLELTFDTMSDQGG